MRGKAGLIGRYIEGDPSFASVSLLLHMDSDFSDSSANAFAVVSSSGSATVSSAQSKFGGASGLFTGATGEHLNYGDEPEFDFADNDFTIEAWYRSDETDEENAIFVNANTTGGLYFGFESGNFRLGRRSIAGDFDYTHYPPVGVWTHYAVSRASGMTRMFIDGSMVVEDYGYDGPFTYAAGDLTIGGIPSIGYTLNGNLDELRITNGVARYTANFTPPAAPFPNF